MARGLGVGLKVIAPKRDIFNAERQVRAIENALSHNALAVKADFGVTTQTWSHQPAFIIKEREFAREIFTEDEIYGYVSGGTRPHPIRARNAPMLAFQSGYKAKTRPRVIASRPGGKFGPTVFAEQVMHPGTEARGFDVEIATKWRKEWPRNLQRAISAAFH